LELPNKIDERVYNSLVREFNIQDGCAILEFNCGKAPIVNSLSPGVYYQGVDQQADLFPFVKAIYPSGIFSTYSTETLLSGEPNKVFSLVIINNIYDTKHNITEGMCSTQIGEVSNLDMLLEVAQKALVDSGSIVIVDCDATWRTLVPEASRRVPIVSSDPRPLVFVLGQ
jgi:hypothetical protein